MNLSVLTVLCCPSCRGDLGVEDSSGQVEVIEEGTIRCRQCAAEYQIRAGILDLIPSEQGGSQDIERENRDNLAREYKNADVAATLARVSRHHYVPAMKLAAESFGNKFSQHDWVLDIGAGWGWHWLGIVNPNVVAMDVSLDSLSVAKRLLGSQVDRNVHLVCADAAQLPIKDRAVDGIWTAQTFQHIPQTALERCLAHSQRPVKEAGMWRFTGSTGRF